MAEQEKPRGSSGETIPVVSGRVLISRLKPNVGIEGSRGFLAGNVEELTPLITATLDSEPWFRKLAKKVADHEQSAILVASLGAVVIIAAGVAGFEFGVRNGRDIRQFLPKKEK